MNGAVFQVSDVGSAESIYTSGEEDSLYEAQRRELENVALVELELSKSKPVAFSVRTNVAFDGATQGIDAPVETRVITFAPKDFLHIKCKFDHHWWIGRLVRVGTPLVFIPSPAKLELIRGNFMPAAEVGNRELRLLESINSSTVPNIPANIDPSQQKSPNERIGPVQNRQNLPDNDIFEEEVPELCEQAAETSATIGPKKNVNLTAASTVPSSQTKKKNFFRKAELPPYEMVPIMRPIILIGPALKGYEVTDLMQKAIFDYLKKQFEGRISFSRICMDISLAKRLSSLQNLDKKTPPSGARSRQITALLAIQQEIERIFDLASTTHLVLLDCDTINHPNQLSKTCLAPINIYLKISSLRVLQRLIKTRGKFQKKNAGVQTAAAEKLLQCPNESFDLIIEQNTLAAAQEALKETLESYWQATHPTTHHGHASKVEKLLGSTTSPTSTHFVPQHSPVGPLFGHDGEVLPTKIPLTPGRPGLMSAIAYAGPTGFNMSELTVLAGARAGTQYSSQETSTDLPDLAAAAQNQSVITAKDSPASKPVANRTVIAVTDSQGNHRSLSQDGSSTPDARTKAAAAVARQKARHLDQDRLLRMANAPGLHQVPSHGDNSETPQVFQSRSARQAKERMEELERARIEAEKMYGKKKRGRRLKADPGMNV